MNQVLRWLTSLFAAPIAASLAFILVYEWAAMMAGASDSTGLDDGAIRAEALMLPLMVAGLIVVSWIWVLPLSFAFRRARRLMAALSIAIPPWLAAAAILHAPEGEPFVHNAWLTLPFVGLPLFVSALVSVIAVRK